jgi:hypothetical protein
VIELTKFIYEMGCPDRFFFWQQTGPASPHTPDRAGLAAAMRQKRVTVGKKA